LIFYLKNSLADLGLLGCAAYGCFGIPVLPTHRCSRAGRYRVQHVIEERGGNAKLIDWLDEITADCPKKMAHNTNDSCGARRPDLPRVL
jgi:hypothetical protein